MGVISNWWFLKGPIFGVGPGGGINFLILQIGRIQWDIRAVFCPICVGITFLKSIYVRRSRATSSNWRILYPIWCRTKKNLYLPKVYNLNFQWKCFTFKREKIWNSLTYVTSLIWRKKMMKSCSFWVQKKKSERHTKLSKGKKLMNVWKQKRKDVGERENF